MMTKHKSIIILLVASICSTQSPSGGKDTALGGSHKDQGTLEVLSSDTLSNLGLPVAERTDTEPAIFLPFFVGVNAVKAESYPEGSLSDEETQIYPIFSHEGLFV